MPAVLSHCSGPDNLPTEVRPFIHRGSHISTQWKESQTRCGGITQGWTTFLLRSGPLYTEAHISPHNGK
ncbi:hypothetical protein J6590_042028, partial [Homalodisca vitripennis]